MSFLFYFISRFGRDMERFRPRSRAELKKEEKKKPPQKIFFSLRKLTRGKRL
jgi:hypothetical protein